MVLVPVMPFDVCGAMSQGYIGYHIQQALRYALACRNKNIPVVSLVTQVVVERNDPAFQNPSKPIGTFYTKEEAEKLVEIGDFAAFDSDWTEFGSGYVKAKALDDRVGCAVMLELLKEDLPMDCTFAFTV